MSQNSSPLVSVVTPVYNGAKFLAECITSVLCQRYGQFDYTIVNNCSTDETLEIAHQFQRQDKRITIVSNPKFVGAIDNHNIALRYISKESKYCKVVSADDWLYPECLEKLAGLAETSPSVGILQGYVINSSGVRWPGLPVEKSVFDGRTIARLYLLGDIRFTGIPSSNLYRSSLVRGTGDFFPGQRPSADAAACLRCLQHCDFGIVHQILSFERVHDQTITAQVQSFDSYLLDRIELVLEYGGLFLTRDEMDARIERMLRNYYDVLASAVLNAREREYWRYHEGRLAELGRKLYGAALGKALLSKIADLCMNPKQTITKGLRRLTLA